MTTRPFSTMRRPETPARRARIEEIKTALANATSTIAPMTSSPGPEWAAGVYEATGTATESSGPMLNLKQVSRDGAVPEIIARFHEAIGGLGKIGGPYRDQAESKE
jgi:hypothetical protein